jgi:hypothetical protein
MEHRFSGLGRVKCSQLPNISANAAVAIFRVTAYLLWPSKSVLVGLFSRHIMELIWWSVKIRENLWTSITVLSYCRYGQSQRHNATDRRYGHWALETTHISFCFSVATRRTGIRATAQNSAASLILFHRKIFKSLPSSNLISHVCQNTCSLKRSDVHKQIKPCLSILTTPIALFACLNVSLKKLG